MRKVMSMSVVIYGEEPNESVTFPALFMSRHNYDELCYRIDSVVVKEWPGARRMCGPDGKTWLEKKWVTENVGIGKGHKAMRRIRGQGFISSEGD